MDQAAKRSFSLLVFIDVFRSKVILSYQFLISIFSNNVKPIIFREVWLSVSFITNGNVNIFLTQVQTFVSITDPSWMLIISCTYTYAQKLIFACNLALLLQLPHKYNFLISFSWIVARNSFQHCGCANILAQADADPGTNVVLTGLSLSHFTGLPEPTFLGLCEHHSHEDVDNVIKYQQKSVSPRKYVFYERYSFSIILYFYFLGFLNIFNIPILTPISTVWYSMLQKS